MFVQCFDLKLVKIFLVSTFHVVTIILGGILTINKESSLSGGTLLVIVCMLML